MKACILILFLGILAGGLFALALDSPGVRADSCNCGSTSIDCTTHFEGIANDGQGQACCTVPTLLPTDRLKFKITRKENSSCARSKLFPIETSGATCPIGSDREPMPSVGVQTCWNGSNTRFHTDTFNIQRCCDNDDGTLTVEVRQLNDTVCTGSEITGTFDSNQDPLCSNCTNPGDCTWAQCSSCS